MRICYLCSKIFFTALLILSGNKIFSQQFTQQVKQYITTSAKTIALTDAKVIDGTGKPSRQHQTIIIIDGKIVQAGNSSDIKIPAQAEVINCSGKTVIPGLVMLHEHLYYTNFLDNFFNVSEMPFTFPRLYLAGGSTTVRTAGSIEPQTDLAIKRMISEGKLIGPDMDVTAPYIERKGFDIPSINIIKDENEAAASVNFWADKGCTSFKMYMHATKADLAAVVREAHKRNLKVTGHLCAITYREAAETGIDDLEHGFYASSDFDHNKKENEFDFVPSQIALQKQEVNSSEVKDLINLLVKKHVALTSTLPVFEPNTGREVVLGGGVDALIPQLKETVTTRWQKAQGKDSASFIQFKKEMAWEKQFYDAGGLLVAGTDPTGSGRTIAGYGSRREVELLVEAGFTAVQAIKICSLNGAVYLGREKQIGTIEVGKDADIVLINGDIETNINDIRKMEIVFKKGVGFDSQKIFESVKGKVGLN